MTRAAAAALAALRVQAELLQSFAMRTAVEGFGEEQKQQ